MSEEVFPDEAISEMQKFLRGREAITRSQRIRIAQMLGEIPFLRKSNSTWQSVAARHALAARHRDQIVKAMVAALAEIGEPRP